MTRREKGILAVTGLVALVGVGSLFLGNKPVFAPPADNKVDAAQIQAVIKSAVDAGLNPTDVALLGAIGKPWRLAAVYDKPLNRGQAVKVQSTHRYSGYVELGSGKLAVVDGYEYQEGDTLEGGGFKVVAIAPERVTLESLANGDREDVPYEGQEALGQ
ncbi:MAG: hypothetical protein AB7U59_07370 [Desulfovibrionaceae bacterium]